MTLTADGAAAAPEHTVSVIVPLYNKGHVIARAIDSIRAQQWQPTEIIVVDDGSTDDGADRVAAIDDPRLRLVRQVNGGPGAARNAGIALATSTHLAFLDADDEWSPGFLDAAMAAVASRPDVGLVGVGYTIAPSGRRNNSGLEHLGGFYEIGPDAPTTLLDDLEVFTSLQFSVVRADLVRSLGGYFDRDRARYSEDSYLLIQLLLAGPVAIVPASFGTYHTEESALFGGGTEATPPPHLYFSEAPTLLARCAEAKRPLLEAFLAERALDRAKVYALVGEGAQARQLINDFSGGRGPGPAAWRRVRLLAAIAPVLPRVRRVARRLRG